MQTMFKSFFLLCLLLFSGQAFGQHAIQHLLKLDKDGIKVYVHRHKNSNLRAFKATTCISASLDSMLAVMFDNDAYTQWVHACNKSFLIEKVSFFERYHFQTIDIPYPFKDRDFVLHSVIEHDPLTKTVTIRTSAVIDYCLNKPLAPCHFIQHSDHVRVNLSVGTFKLEPCEKGIQVTWLQHTDPAGNLPDWLVNQFLEDTPYWTLKNLAQKATEEKYRYAKLIYDIDGYAIALDVAAPEAIKKAKDFNVYPSF